jgi:HPt (histidine-containing phosphotransfer) domain-containing protein
MNDYLSKPVELAGLSEMLSRWMPVRRGGGAVMPAETAGALDGSVFDLVSLLRRLMGDRELAGLLLKGFLADAPAQVQLLRACIDREDGNGVRLQAHALRGSAATVAAEAVRAVAAAIEIAAGAAQIERCRELLAGLDTELDRFRAAVQKVEWV